MTIILHFVLMFSCVFSSAIALIMLCDSQRHIYIAVQVFEINTRCLTELSPVELVDLFSSMGQQHQQSSVMLPASVSTDLQSLMGPFRYCKPTDTVRYNIIFSYSTQLVHNDV